MERILQILGGMNQGGAENFLMNLNRNIITKDVRFDYLVNRKGIFDEEIKRMGGKVFYIPALQNIGMYKYIKILDNFYKEHSEYKIVNSHLNKVTGLILERAKKANIPIRISHSHSSKSSKNIIVNTYKMFLGSKIKKNATLYLGCSDKANKWLYGRYSDKAVILNNGIETKKFKFNDSIRNKIRNQLNIKENEVILGHVGRFTPVKNHLFLIDIFKEYNKRNLNSKLLLVGDGELKDKIKRKVQMLGLNNKVIMLGNRNDINELNQAIDFFVFPSVFEGMPMALIEAQASGLQIFASSNITKMVDITGNIKFISIKESPQLWAENIICTKLDRKDETEKIIEAGYDIKETANKYLKLIGCE